MRAGVTVLCMTNATPERVCTLTSQCDPHRSQISTESITLDDSQHHLTHRGCASSSASLDLASLRLLIRSLAFTMVVARLIVLLRSHGCRETELFQYDCGRSATPNSRSGLWGVAKDNPAIRRLLFPLEQFDRILVQRSRNVHGVGPLLVVIDALDENGGRTVACQIANRSCRCYLNR